MSDRTVLDVIRDLQSIVISPDKKLCHEAAQVLAVTNSGFEQIKAANDRLQAVIQAQTTALTAATEMADAAEALLPRDGRGHHTTTFELNLRAAVAAFRAAGG